MKKLLSVVLSAVMVLSLLPMEIFAVSAETPAGTSGTVGTTGHVGTTEVTHLTEVLDGYIGIYTKSDLNAVRNNLSGKYILMNHIEFTDADFAEGGAFYNGGQGWQPIGTDEDNAFTGVFDGNGFAIKNLQINITSDDTVYSGLFGWNNGTIKNLGMVDGSVSVTTSSYAYAGGIAGRNRRTITNCYNTGSVTATGAYSAYAGGIVGDNSYGTITNCYNTGSVSATSTSTSTSTSSFAFAGGIAGYNSGTITNCYNTGSVSATSTSTSTSSYACAGGIAGEICNYTIENCYNTGSVTATSTYAFAGGIAGCNGYGTIQNCYNTGSVTVTGAYSAYAGGIAGYNDDGTITNCYYANNISKGVGNGTDTAVKCTLEEMQLQDTFVGFDFDAVWTFEETLVTHPFPVLKSISHEVPEGYTGIYTKEDLNAVRNNLSGKYILMNHIEFTDADFAEGGAFYNGGQGWQPIGTDEDNAFTGVFDGNGFAIKNLQNNITSEDRAYAGLFGYNNGTIKNLGMVDGNVSATSTSTSTSSYAYAYAGGIAGYNSGTIQNCYNTGSVSATSTSSYAYAYAFAGSIAGDNDGTIENCYNTGSVSATTTSYRASAYAGGIAGINYGTIQNCYNTGNVTATATLSDASAGGIAGLCIYSDTTITNCYNTGSVTATATSSAAYAGGIAGYNDHGTIENCYNTGSVTVTASSSALAGGIAGYNYYGTITNCYNASGVTATATSYHAYAGGIVGANYNCTITNCYYADIIDKGVGNGTDKAVKCTLDEMKLQNTFVGFDFETIWTMTGHEDYLYPELNSVPMVFEKALDSIEVTTKPDKLTYLEGDDFDPTGMVVTAYYSDGTSAIITDYSIDVSASDLGKKTVTITYKGKTTSFTVDVVYTVTFKNWNGDVLSTETYHYGDTVAVFFNCVPDRTGYVFLGWSIDRNATTPEFTSAGTKTFTIGASDVTLYAVWGLEHATCVPSEWIIDQNPTCTQPGSKHIECTECGETLREEMIPATGHNYVYTQTVAPSCTEEGYDLYTCDHSGCGSTKKQMIDKLSHAYGNDNVCDKCGHTIPTNHTHSYTATVVPPTCSSFGYTEHTCSCGHSYRTDYIENTVHAWTTTVTKEKTCTTDGLKLHACENCDASFTEIIPASHNWQDTVTQPATCTTDGQLSRTCADCGSVETQIIPAGHTWDAGTQTQAPTCTEAGLLHHTCTVCGHEEDSLIGPLGHRYVNGVCTRCGAKFIDNVTNDTDHPEYGMYFEVDDVKSGYGPDLINEYGVLLDYNSDANLKKVAVYLTQDGTMWRRCIAVVGENITYATYVPYLSYDEDIKYTGLNSAWINTFRLQENSDGIWCYSDYATIGVNLEDAYGNLLLSLYDIGQAGAKTRIFDDLDEMIAWLKEGKEVPEGYTGIYTKEDLNAVRNNLSGKYILMNHIEFTDADFAEGGAFYNGGQGWQPIGTDEDNAFTGIFDGNGFAIKNLQINITSEDGAYAGLFGCNEGTIKNLGMVDGTVSATSTSSDVYAGGIGGYNSGTITNCYNTGSVTVTASSGALAGGIAGYNSGSATIQNCYNTGRVTSTGDVGGITGINNGTIQNCYNTGNVTATSSSYDASAGGIAGVIRGSSCSITDCYNTGSVSATSTASGAYAGGITGSNSAATIQNCYNTGSVSATSTSYYVYACAGGIVGGNSYGTIENCYNTGSVTTTASSSSSSNSSCAYSGGIAGDNSYNGIIENCYNTGSVSASASSFYTSSYAYAGGIAGSNDGTITNCYYADIIDKGVGNGTDTAVKCTLEEMKLQDTFVGFNFEIVWQIDSTADYPYPTLRNMPDFSKASVTSIEITTKPNKLTYLDSDAFDSTGMVVTVYYDNGTNEIITDYSIDVSASDLGKKTVTIIYGGKTTSFTVDVVYTVTFKNWNGDVLSTEIYHYGDKVTAPANPTKVADNTYTYAFAGWDKEVVACAGDATYTAQYTAVYKNYTITFKNWDGAVLSSKTYHWGDAVTEPATPTKHADNTYTYVFTGWDKEVVACAGDATYTATYTPIYIDYTVIFKNWNGDVLSTKTYHWGDVVTAPSNPTRAADNTYTYTFKGWDKTVVNCAGNATYTAQYTAVYKNYTITFKNWDGAVLSSKTYHWGDAVTEPATPSKHADNTYTYVFTGWDQDVVNCAGNVTYTATYERTYIDYTVKFVDWDGNVISSDTYHWGEDVIAPADPVRPDDDRYAYTFTGWDKEIVNCAGNATYTAVYSSELLVPTTITSDKYTIGGGMISKIELGTKVSTLISNLNEGAYIKVFKGTTEVSGEALIGTGMVIKIMDGNTVVTSATVVVTGDTNGDGKLTVTDYVQLQAHLLQKTLLQGAAAKAADTSGDGKISVTDYVQMQAHILGKSTVQPKSV